MNNEVSLIPVSVGDLPRSSFAILCDPHFNTHLFLSEYFRKVNDSNSRNKITTAEVLNENYRYCGSVDWSAVCDCGGFLAVLTTFS